MRTKNAIIYLREPRTLDLGKCTPELVHEAAHQFLLYGDPGLSEIWYKRHKIARSGDWNDSSVARENGLIDKRAAIDYTKDSIDPNIPKGEADFSKFESGVYIEIFGADLPYSKMVDDFLTELATLPKQLRLCVRNVALFPGLNYNGVFQSFERASETRRIVEEDIAYHTSGFYAASTFRGKTMPETMMQILALIDKDPRVRSRLESLLEFSFLDSDVSGWLLDPKERKEILLERRAAEDKCATLQPNFDGG